MNIYFQQAKEQITCAKIMEVLEKVIDVFKAHRLTEPELVRTTLQAILMLHDLHYELKTEAQSMVGAPNLTIGLRK